MQHIEMKMCTLKLLKAFNNKKVTSKSGDKKCIYLKKESKHVLIFLSQNKMGNVWADSSVIRLK